MSDTHAKLSASGAKKWLNCPLSIKLESEFPNTDTCYSIEGSTAHTLAENKLKLALNLIKKGAYTKNIKTLNEVDEEMQEYTDGYKDFVIERYNASKRKVSDTLIEIEKKVSYSDYVKDGFGTCDAVIISDDYMGIIDLKYGKGVKVSAKDNPQLKLYALGALSEYEYLYDIKGIEMTIYQPRLDSISEDFIPTKELIEWGKTFVKPRADMAYYNKGTCLAGQHCDSGFCRARPICRAYSEERLKIVSYEYKEPHKLTNEEISDILDQIEGINSWIKSVKEYAYNQALKQGVNYPGYKLVEGRSRRIYSDNEKVESLLKENGYAENDIYDKNIKAITNMEKLLGKKKFDTLLKDYIIKTPSSPALVQETDKRPAVNSINTAQEDFKQINY